MSIVNVNSFAVVTVLVNVVQVARHRRSVQSYSHPVGRDRTPPPLGFGGLGQPFPRWSRRYGRWALLAALAALVDGKLLLAGMTGLGLYRWAIADPELTQARALFRTILRQGQHWLEGPWVRPLALSSGGFGLTYLTTLCWADLGPLPTLLLLGFGSVNLLTLGLLWQGRDRLWNPGFQAASPAVAPPADAAAAPAAQPPNAEGASPEEQHWQRLSEGDPLKRLLAVRWLTQWSLDNPAGEAAYLPGTQISVRDHLVDCFHLMLAQEGEPAVRAALRDAIALLRPKPQLGPGQPPLSPLAKATRSRQGASVVSLQRRVEYLEP